MHRHPLAVVRNLRCCHAEVEGARQGSDDLVQSRADVIRGPAVAGAVADGPIAEVVVRQHKHAVNKRRNLEARADSHVDAPRQGNHDQPRLLGCVEVTDGAELSGCSLGGHRGRPCVDFVHVHGHLAKEPVPCVGDLDSSRSSKPDNGERIVSPLLAQAFLELLTCARAKSAVRGPQTVQRARHQHRQVLGVLGSCLLDGAHLLHACPVAMGGCRRLAADLQQPLRYAARRCRRRCNGGLAAHSNAVRCS
mmetsp:Transcript_15070/g.56803  ORF Transcript_15070/g.56803 Transcript_15070/m.56803 type:complete len:250 (+) Transcript_15070:3462-4211(+)